MSVSRTATVGCLIVANRPKRAVHTSVTNAGKGHQFVVGSNQYPLLRRSKLYHVVVRAKRRGLYSVYTVRPHFFIRGKGFRLTNIKLTYRRDIRLLLSGSAPLLFVRSDTPSLFSFPALLSTVNYDLPRRTLSCAPAVGRACYQAVLRTLSRARPISRT